MGTLFSLDEVGLALNGTTILDRVSVEVPDEGITVVVGPSGSGKSTLLRLLNGLERATTGIVTFRGDDLTSLDVRRLRRQVGMVFQRPTVFDGTAFENLRVADDEMTRPAATMALERVGLGSEILDRDARQLSGGEAQRLCLARTLATEPDVILMDEPTSSLDEENVELIEQLVKNIVARGVRVVLVSHDRSQVERLATWIVQVSDGRVVNSGSAATLDHLHNDVAVWRRSTSDESTEGESS